MELQQIELYKFDELEPEVQEKVLEKQREINIDCGWWDFSIDDIKIELREKYGIEVKDIYFEFYRSRYLQISKPDIIDLKKFLKEANVELLEDIDVSIEEERESNYVRVRDEKYYENYDEIDLESDVKEIVIEEREEKIEIIEKELNVFLSNLLHTYLKRLEEEYSELMEDKNIIETFECNDWKFLKDGRVI